MTKAPKTALPKFVVIVKRDGGNGVPSGVYPIAYQVVRETPTSYEFLIPAGPQSGGGISRHDYFGKNVGLRSTSDRSRFARENHKYFVNKNTVLCSSPDAKLPPRAHEFAAKVEAMKEAASRSAEASNEATRMLAQEKAAMVARHRAEVAELAKRHQSYVQGAQDAEYSARQTIYDLMYNTPIASKITETA